MREQAAVIWRNVHVVIAFVDLTKEAEKIAPDRLRVELVARLERGFEQIAAHQFAPLGEGDEENAVEDFLRWLDRRAEPELRAIGGIDEKGDQAFA